MGFPTKTGFILVDTLEVVHLFVPFEVDTRGMETFRGCRTLIQCFPDAFSYMLHYEQPDETISHSLLGSCIPHNVSSGYYDLSH